MSFNYTYKKNGKVVRSISKCWTSLLFMQIMKDIMTIDKLGSDKSTKEVSFIIKREED